MAIDTPLTGFSAAQLRALEEDRAAAKARNAAGSGDVERINKTAEDFEAVFLAQMMKTMFNDLNLLAGAGADEKTKDSAANEVYKSMMADQYGRIMARNGGIGLAEDLARAMLELQEVNKK